MPHVYTLTCSRVYFRFIAREKGPQQYSHTLRHGKTLSNTHCFCLFWSIPLWDEHTCVFVSCSIVCKSLCVLYTRIADFQWNRNVKKKTKWVTKINSKYTRHTYVIAEMRNSLYCLEMSEVYVVKTINHKLSVEPALLPYETWNNKIKKRLPLCDLLPCFVAYRFLLHISGLKRIRQLKNDDKVLVSQNALKSTTDKTD